MFTSIGKKDTTVTTAMLVLMPRPKISIMIGATAATGVERNTITTGSEACSRLRLIEKESTTATANKLLAARPSPAARRVKPACPAITAQFCRTDLATSSGSGTRYFGIRKPTTVSCQSAMKIATPRTICIRRLSSNRGVCEIIGSIRKLNVVTPIDRKAFDRRPDAEAGTGQHTGQHHRQPHLGRIIGKQRIQHHGADALIGAGPFGGDGPEHGGGCGDLEAGEQIGQRARNQQIAQRLRPRRRQHMHQFALPLVGGL